MKALLLVLALLTFQNCAWGDWHEVHVKSQEAGIDIRTNKVVRIEGPIGPGSSIPVMMDLMLTSYLPGDRVVVVESGGGFELEGRLIIDSLLNDRSRGNGRLICVVNHYAHSMAFNLTSYCDVRLVTKKAVCVVHKVACYGDEVERPTATNLKKRADYCQDLDERYREANMHAMHLTPEQYDKAADAEKTWDAEELIKIGYFQGYATIEDASTKK